MNEKIYNLIMAQFKKWSEEGTFMDNIDKCYKEAYHLYQTDSEFRKKAQEMTLQLQKAIMNEEK